MNPNRHTRLKDCIAVALLTAAAVALALCLTECRSTLATATESREASTEALHTATSRADSVYVHDSVYVYVTTERTEVTRWRTQWRTLTVHDTVRCHSTDTIVKTETVEKVVTAPQKGGSTGWAVAFALMAAIAVYTLIKTLLKQFRVRS